MLTDNYNDPLILVVEDDNNHAELILRAFEDAPEEYRLKVADSMCDATAAIERHSPSLVLTDYRLPDGNGSELVVMAAGSWPVILMTSQGSEQVAVEAMKLGAHDYITKSPVAFNELPRTVKYALTTWSLIVARRQAAADLLAKQDWERTFDAVPDLIAIIDLDHTITRANKAMAHQCGVPLDKIVGRKCYEVMHDLAIPHAGCPYVRMIQDGCGYSERIEESNLNGVFDITVSPLYNAEGRITASVHIAHDVTEHLKTEEERLRLAEQFQQTQKLESLGVLAGGIAHDFNNILTIILGHCYLVKENCDSGMSDKDRVQLIEDAGNRAAALCRQMLAYAGQTPHVQTRVNLWLLVDDVVKMLQSALKKNVVVELDCNRDIHELIGDNAQIQQIVMNLIINAAEAIGDKNGTIKVVLKKTIILAEQPDIDFMGKAIPAWEYASLEVSDTGCGIDDETKKRIFEPFFTTKFTGRGLGMSAVLGSIKAHDGALQLFSTVDEGTTFKVLLPLTATPHSVDTSPAVVSFSLEKCNGTVLLVDDEESLRAIGAELLDAMGFSVVTASNGREALEIYRKNENGIDIILLDMLMPVMGGVETYRILREISPLIPVVIYSGYSTEEIMSEIGDDKHASIIQKPYALDLLQNTLMMLLHERTAETTGTAAL